MEDNNNITKIHDKEQEEDEEALSLSDLPIDDHHQRVNQHDHENKYSQSIDHEEQNSGDFFEFFNNLEKSSEMSHAEDIFFCGRLVPWKDPTIPDEHGPTATINRRRCESLSELKMTERSNSTKSRLVRNCRSLDYGKMRRNSSLSKNIMRAFSSKSNASEKIDINSSSSIVMQKVPKPRWYVLMFGLNVKFPQEMDLQDIKNRQTRHRGKARGAMLTTSFESPGNTPVSHQSDNRKSSWGLLKVLSCKNHASVPVTTSISYVPHV